MKGGGRVPKKDVMGKVREGYKKLTGALGKGRKDAVYKRKEEHASWKDTLREPDRMIGMTKEEYSYAIKGQQNLQKFVWGTGGFQFARMDTMDLKWRKFTQNRIYNQIRREMIMRRHGVDSK